jgi:hypothetical protein
MRENAEHARLKGGERPTVRSGDIARNPAHTQSEEGTTKHTKDTKKEPDRN